MKKLFVSTFIVASFAIYSILYNKSTATKAQISFVSASQSSKGPSGSQIAVLFRDGEYTGPVVDAFYGNIQVKAVIQNGKLTDVQFLQYPNDQRESIEINTAAMPILKEEAIQAQSANVDIVTRATDSTHAFTESLSQALSQAK